MFPRVVVAMCTGAGAGAGMVVGAVADAVAVAGVVAGVVTKPRAQKNPRLALF